MTDQVIRLGQIASVDGNSVTALVGNENVTFPREEIHSPNTPVDVGIEVAVPLPLQGIPLHEGRSIVGSHGDDVLLPGLVYRLATIVIHQISDGTVKTDIGAFKVDLDTVALLDASMPPGPKTAGHLFIPGARLRVGLSHNVATGEVWIAVVMRD